MEGITWSISIAGSDEWISLATFGIDASTTDVHVDHTGAKYDLAYVRSLPLLDFSTVQILTDVEEVTEDVEALPDNDGARTRNVR